MHTPRPDGDWSRYAADDTAVKVWIPVALDDCLDTLTDRFNQTKSDLARNALMLHVHGRLVFESLVEHKLWRLCRRQQIEDTRKFCLMGTSLKLSDSPRTAYIRAFGKNTKDLKVWMPRALQDEIGSLAIDVGLTVSEYTRRALTAYYLGRTKLDPLQSGPSEDG